MAGGEGGLTERFTSTGSKHDINKMSECVPTAEAQNADGRAAVPSQSHGFGWRVGGGGRGCGFQQQLLLFLLIYSSSKKKELPGP